MTSIRRISSKAIPRVYIRHHYSGFRHGRPFPVSGSAAARVLSRIALGENNHRFQWINSTQAGDRFGDRAIRH